MCFAESFPFSILYLLKNDSSTVFLWRKDRLDNRMEESEMRFKESIAFIAGPLYIWYLSKGEKSERMHKRCKKRSRNGHNFSLNTRSYIVNFKCNWLIIILRLTVNISYILGTFLSDTMYIRILVSPSIYINITFENILILKKQNNVAIYNFIIFFKF